MLVGMSSRFVPGDDFDFYPDIDESQHPNKRQRGTGYPSVAANTVYFPSVEYEDWPYNDTKTHQIPFQGTADTLHWPPYLFLIDEDNYLRAKLDVKGELRLSDRLVKMPFPSGGTGEGAGATCANVLNYDAVGDGVTDDTQAFKDALSESSCLFIPRGIFKITDPLPLQERNGEGRLRITGAGADSVILIPNLPLVQFTDTTPQNYIVEIDNVKLVGDLDDPSLTPIMLDFSGKSNHDPIQVGKFDNSAENHFRRKIHLSSIWFRQTRQGSGSCVKVQDCFDFRMKNCFFQYENWDLNGDLKEEDTTDEDGNTITVETPIYSISSPVWLSRTNGHVHSNLVFMVVPAAHKIRAIEVDDSVKVIPDAEDPNCDCAADNLFQGDLVIESNQFLAYRQRLFPIRSLYKQRDLIKGTSGYFLGQGTGVHVANQDDRTISKVVARNNLAEVFLKESWADLQAKRDSLGDLDAEPNSMKEAVRFQCFPGYVMDRRDHMAMNDNWFNVGKTYEWPEYKELRDGAAKALEFIRFQVDQLTNYVFIECGGDFTPSIATQRVTFAGSGGAGGSIDRFGPLPYDLQNRTTNQNSTIFNYSLDGSASAFWGVTYNIGKDPAVGGGAVNSGPTVDLSQMEKLHFIAWDPTLTDTQSSWLTVRFPDNSGFEQTLVDSTGSEVPEVEITNAPQEFTLFQKTNVKDNFADSVYDFITFKVLGETASGDTAVSGDRQLALAGVWWQPIVSDNVDAIPVTTKDSFHFDTGVFIKSWTTYSASIPSEPDIKRPREFDIILNNVAFIYDNALAAYALLGTNDPTDRLRAQAIGNALQKAPFFDQDYSWEVTRDDDGNITDITYVNDSQNDGRMRNAYQWGPALKPRAFYYLYEGTASTDPDNDGKRWIKMSVPFWVVRKGFDDTTNEEKTVGNTLGEVNVDAYQVSFWLGNSTWACMLLNSLANLIYTNGRVPDDDNRARQYREACLKNLEFHEFMRSTTDMGGFHGGYIKLFEPGGATVDQFDFLRLPWKSVEHGTDIVSYGHQLLNVIGPHHPDWMRIHEGILKHASKFIYRHFVDVYEVDPQGGYGEQRRKTVYYTGGGDPDPAEVQDAERKYGLNKDNIPLDVLLWAIQAQYKMFYPQNQAMAYALRYMTTDGSPAALAKYSEPSGEGWIEGTGQLAVTLHCMGQQHLADKKLHACLPYRVGKNGGFWSTTGVASTGFTLPGSTNLWKYYPDEHLGATAWWLMGWYSVNPYQFPNDELEMVGTVPRFTNEPKFTDKLLVGEQNKSHSTIDQGDVYAAGDVFTQALRLSSSSGQGPLAIGGTPTTSVADAATTDVRGDLIVQGTTTLNGGLNTNSGVSAQEFCVPTTVDDSFTRSTICLSAPPNVEPYSSRNLGAAAFTYTGDQDGELGDLVVERLWTRVPTDQNFLTVDDISNATNPEGDGYVAFRFIAPDGFNAATRYGMEVRERDIDNNTAERPGDIKCSSVHTDVLAGPDRSSVATNVTRVDTRLDCKVGIEAWNPLGNNEVRLQTMQQGSSGDVNNNAIWNDDPSNIKNVSPTFKVGDLAVWACGKNVKTEETNNISGMRGLKIGTYIRGGGSNNVATAKTNDGTGNDASIFWASSVSSVLYDEESLNTNTADADQAGPTVIPGTWQVIGQTGGQDNQSIGNGFDANVDLYLIMKISDNTSGDLF